MTILKIIGIPVFLTGVILVLGPLFDYKVAEQISAVVIATLFCYLQVFISYKRNEHSVKNQLRR